LALHLDDWFLRRSNTAFTGCNGIEAIEAVAASFATELGWNDATRAAEIEACRGILERIADPLRTAHSRTSSNSP